MRGRQHSTSSRAVGAFDLGPALSAELDRVGVSLETAELGDAVVAGALGDVVWIMSAIAHIGGDRAWEGSEQRALAKLVDLPDNAGADPFWDAFSRP